MSKCFVKDCNSETNDSLKNISYFKFPVNNEILMKKWLQQIRIQEWKPTGSDRICSIHFRYEDIEYRPYKANPFLKPTAIPTIFPGRSTKTMNIGQENLNKKQTNLPLGTIKTTNQTDASTSHLHSGRVILIPRRNQNPQISKPNLPQLPTDNLVNSQNSVIPNNLSKIAISSNSQDKLLRSPPTKLRKILPKPGIYTLPRSSLQSLTPLTRNRALLHPDILIVPAIQKSIKNSPEKIDPQPPSPPIKKRPILRITINKKHERTVLNESSCMNSHEKETSNTNSESSRDDASSIDQVDDTKKEITIENASANKSVTFKLHPVTGEIIVTTHQLNDTSTDKPVKKNRKARKRRNPFGRTAGTNLHYLYRKAEQDCNILRKRLKMLRDQHKEEQEEIQKLKEHLAVLGNKVTKSYGDHSISRDLKSKEIVESDYDYERLLVEVKKIKEVIQKTRKNVPNRKKEEIMRNQDTNNEELQVVAKEGGPLNTRNSSDGEIVGEVADDIGDDKCDDLGTRIDKEMLDITEDSESEDINCNAEFLDSEFITT